METYIYARWSSLEQGKGSTLERQLANCTAYADAKGWPVTATITDRGKSAFTGANIRDGELGKFAERVRNGEIQDAVLIVEELDRISRQPSDVMLTWLSPLIRAGLTIIVTQSGQVINRQMLDTDLGSFMMLIVTGFGSFNESKKKAERGVAAWESKRAAAREGRNVTRGHRHPLWLEVGQDGSFRPIPDRVAIIERIFAERLAGAGKGLIAKRLNLDRVQTWPSTAKISAPSWQQSYVGRILSNRTVIGEWQPHNGTRGGDRTPKGEAIQGYYPVVISPAIFAQANDKRAENQRKRQGRGRAISNILGIRARCGTCGSKMQASGSTAYLTKQDGSRVRHYFLYCTAAKTANTCENHRGWTYDRVEGPLLDHILNLAMDDQHFAIADEAAPIQAEVLRIQGDIETLTVRRARSAELFEASGDVDQKNTYLQRCAELEAMKVKLADAEARLAEARGATSPDQHLKRVSEVRADMDSDDEEKRFQARSLVKDALHNLIAEIKFNHHTGTAMVVLVDYLRVFFIEHDGTITQDYDFLNMPESDLKYVYGFITQRGNGVMPILDEPDSLQSSASAGYVARVRASLEQSTKST